jgi:ketol-acid reductoisomerase
MDSEKLSKIMQIYHDSDADLTLLSSQTIAVIGYGNQGRAQALNLRDSGLTILIGNQPDAYAEKARADGFKVLPIDQAARQGQVVMLLIPDEIMPAIFEQHIAPHLAPGKTLVFASGYTVAFGQITPPAGVDVVLLAPRMIGAGVRDLYLSGRGFPSFIAVAQDASGQAKARLLALAKGIGSTRAGVVEVTFQQEAELDLFTEQCFGPAFGQVLMSAVNLLLDEGYPPEAVLLELYMSGEFSYTLAKIAEMGMIEQTQLHSRTSQYGSISRGLRFMLPEIRERMQAGLQEIRSGDFAREWAIEQANGYPTLRSLQETARSLPLSQMERQLRDSLGSPPASPAWGTNAGAHVTPPNPAQTALRRSPFAWLQHLFQARRTPRPASQGVTLAGQQRDGQHLEIKASHAGQQLLESLPVIQSPSEKGAGAQVIPLDKDQIRAVLQGFLDQAMQDSALQAFARKHNISSHYNLADIGLDFYIFFSKDGISAGLGIPPLPAQVRLETTSVTLDGMFTGQIDAPRAALSGQLNFKGDTLKGLSLQQIQKDLCRLYQAERRRVSR